MRYVLLIAIIIILAGGTVYFVATNIAPTPKTVEKTIHVPNK